MGDLFIVIAIEVAGLIGIWFFLNAKIRKSLGLESLLAEVRKEVRALSIEINETTDRNISLVEDRLTALRDLLSEADKRMGLYRRETEKRQGERELYNRLGKRLPEPGREPETRPSVGSSRAAAPVAELDLGIEEPRPNGRPSPPRQETPEAGPRPQEPVRLNLARTVPEVITPKESVIPPKSLRERALELYRGGFSADIIAARVGATVSEIELLVSLEEGRRMAPEETDREPGAMA
jgi:hypothetical protein